METANDETLPTSAEPGDGSPPLGTASPDASTPARGGVAGSVSPRSRTPPLAPLPKRTKTALDTSEENHEMPRIATSPLSRSSEPTKKVVEKVGEKVGEKVENVPKVDGALPSTSDHPPVPNRTLTTWPKDDSCTTTEATTEATTDSPPPVQCRNADALARRNPLPANAHHRFEEEGHRYTVHGSRVERSTTRLLSEWFEAFDPVGCTDAWYEGWSTNPNSKYYETIRRGRESGYSDATIAKKIRSEWTKVGSEASQLGTALHTHCEFDCNGQSHPFDPRISLEIGQYDEFKASKFFVGRGLEPYRTELTISWRSKEGLNVCAGQIDALYQDRDGNKYLVDFKRVVNKHKLGASSGQTWLNVGTAAPDFGRLVVDERLSELLSKRQTLTKAELKAFDFKDLSQSDYVRSGDVFLSPVQDERGFKGACGKAPVAEHLPDTHFTKYSLQTSIYNLMLAATHGIDVEERMYLVRMQADRDTYELVKCADLRHEARTVLREEHRRLIQSTEAPM